MDLDIKPPRLETVECDLLLRHDIVLNVLRLDTIHPFIHGNKWYKLKRNLEHFQQKGVRRVLSFGGAYSNHLYALAAAGKHYSINTLGLVRGEIPDPLNPVLSFASDQGMELVPVSRSDYRRKNDKSFVEGLRTRFGDFQLLPEGGSNLLAVQGCEEIASLLRWKHPHRPKIVALSCGTGATMAGLICGLSDLETERATLVLGIGVLKAEGYLPQEVRNWLELNRCNMPNKWRLEEHYHCGGYARSNSELRSFMEEFSTFSDIPLEPVYTGKLFMALFDMIVRGAIPRGAQLIAIHTGGIYQ